VKSIQVDGDVLAYLQTHGMNAGHSASDVLREALFHAIDIDDDIFNDLMSLGSGPNDSANAILRRELGIQGHANPANPPPVNPPARIDFHIPAGTGTAPWNTHDSAVEGVVGQTLRIYNAGRSIPASGRGHRTGHLCGLHAQQCVQSGHESRTLRSRHRGRRALLDQRARSRLGLRLLAGLTPHQPIMTYWNLIIRYSTAPVPGWIRRRPSNS